MMTGIITPQREATLPLTLSGPAGHAQQVVAVIDTGFTGDLTLPGSMITTLALPRRGRRQATLADGTRVVLDVFAATVTWNGQPLRVLVLRADGPPLLGMNLLYGHLVTLEVVDGGRVTIAPLP